MQVYYYVFWPTLFLVADGLPGGVLSRISGGESTSIKSRPYIVSISYDIFNAQCAASIISKNLILTASHCMPDEYRSMTIRAGSYYQKTNGTLHHVESFSRHENYKLIATGNKRITVNDIAIAKVAPPFEFSDTCQPIPLFEASAMIKPESNGIVSGWGWVLYDDRMKWPPVDSVFNPLQSAVVPVHEKSFCKSELERKNETLYPGQICAGGEGKGPCPGDSGGPLVVDGKLAGIVSYGYGCGLTGYPPTLFTEVAYFRKWIDGQAMKLAGNSLKHVVQATNTDKLEFHHGMNHYEGRPVWS